VDAAGLAAELAEFLRQRLASLLEEADFDPDLVRAVAGEGLAVERVIRDPADARDRAELLRGLRRAGRLAAVHAVVTRATRLADRGDLAGTVLSPAGVVDPALFTSPSERDMLAVVERLEPIATGSRPDRYAALAEGLSDSAATLAAFFDGEHSVLVMADDPALRANRLNLLAVLRNQAAVLADFSRIAG
jgi:glycyl-tRNA synthetase beta chain